MSSKSRAEKERERQVQDKVQAILGAMLKDEDNKYCVDCDAKGPGGPAGTWESSSASDAREFTGTLVSISAE